jgi:hypothetical protein
MNKYSIGVTITPATETTLLTVPTGYCAVVSLAFISNHSGNNKTFSMWWEHSHDVGHEIYIIDGKTFTLSEFLQFSGAEIVLQEGDTLKVLTQSGSDFSVIITFELVPAPTSRIDFPD